MNLEDIPEDIPDLPDGHHDVWWVVIILKVEEESVGVLINKKSGPQSSSSATAQWDLPSPNFANKGDLM